MSALKTRAEERSSERVGPVTTLRDRLSAPVDPGALAILRIGLGALIAWEIWREYDLGFLRADYLDPGFLFRWWLFDWVRPLPEPWFFIVFGVVILAGLCVALGLFYRQAAVLLFGGISYLFLLEKTRYLNHRYLACLFAFLLIIVPAHAAYSLDARRKPWVRTATVPAWSLWLLRFQVGVPYFFAGIAKLNFDWLVRAEPLRLWLAEQTDFPLIGQHFTSDVVVRFFVLSSAALDLFVPAFLLHRRTRAAAYGIALLFHFLNSRLFNIGMFPWMMIVATTVFFDGDWPRRMAAALRSGTSAVRPAVATGFLLGFFVGGFLPETFSAVRAVIGGFGVGVLAFHLLPEQARKATVPARSVGPWRSVTFTRPLAVFLAVWIVAQVLVPLRHFVIAGNAHWTEEGNRFAWHMLLHHKVGTARFRITGGEVAGGPFYIREHLTDFQIRKMVQHPELLLQFAHYIEDYYRDIGASDVEVTVETSVSLNGRPRQRMIGPSVDLTEVRRPYVPPANWIEPLRPYS